MDLIYSFPPPPPPNSFGRVYLHPIRRIHISHTVKGANGTTMVVMLWIVVFVVLSTFRTIPTVGNLRREFFDHARTLIAVNLLRD